MLYLLIILVVFVLFLLSVAYYVTLISSKDVYTKEELSSVMPYITGSIGKLADKYSTVGLVLGFLISAALGAAIPFIANNFFFNSCAIFVVLYLILPIVRERFSSTRVEASEYLRDDAANFIAGRIGLALVGLGSGNGAALMYQWAMVKDSGFLWLLLNLIVLCVLLEVVLLKELEDE